jgi:hypothetical protein
MMGVEQKANRVKLLYRFELHVQDHTNTALPSISIFLFDQAPSLLHPHPSYRDPPCSFLLVTRSTAPEKLIQINENMSNTAPIRKNLSEMLEHVNHLRLASLTGDTALDDCSTSIEGLRVQLQLCRTPGKATLGLIKTESKRVMFHSVEVAIRLVAETARAVFAQPIPTLDHIRWLPGSLRRHALGRPLSSRVACISMDLCHLLAMDPRDAAVLDVGFAVLHLCLGFRDAAHFEDCAPLHLPDVDVARQSRPVRSALFECAMLGLMALARSHACWFEHPTRDGDVLTPPVRIWTQPVPGIVLSRRAAASIPTITTPGVVAARIYTPRRSGQQHAIDQRQEDFWSHLHRELKHLYTIPTTTHATATPSSPLPAQAAAALGIVRDAIRGRNRIFAFVTREFSAELQRVAEAALHNVLVAAKTHFRLPVWTSPRRVFLDGADPGPEPPFTDARACRRWVVQKTCEALARSDDRDERRVAMARAVVEHVCGDADQIVTLSGGTQVLLPALRDPSREWREEMMQYVQFAVFMVAQHVSAWFDGRAVMLMRHSVRRAVDLPGSMDAPALVVEMGSRAWV